MLLDKQDSLNIKNEPYEPVEVALIKFLLKPEHMALDIGAHIGYFTVLMAKHCFKVIAFEPERLNFATLQKNINLINNVILYNAAVMEFSGQKSLYGCDNNSGMHRMYQSRWTPYTWDIVRTVRLDEILNHEQIDFIKMDIEGAEYAALKGMQYILKNSKPILLMEFHPPSIEEYGASPEEEYHFLKTLGYSIRLIPKISIPISFEELDKETRKESGRNILCLPQDQTLF